jgi:hypothetical protein
VVEWLKAPVLKTGNGKPFVGSNPTSSAGVEQAGPVGRPAPLRSLKENMTMHQLSLLGSMAFALPIVLLWPGKKHG